MRRTNRRDRGGFVLVEVVLAGVVAAVGVAAFFQSLEAVRRAARAGHDRLIAGLALERKIYEWEARGEWSDLEDGVTGLGEVTWAAVPRPLDGGVEQNLELRWRKGKTADSLSLSAAPS